jgi:hypothetical protein
MSEKHRIVGLKVARVKTVSKVVDHDRYGEFTVDHHVEVVLEDGTVIRPDAHAQRPSLIINKSEWRKV